MEPDEVIMALHTAGTELSQALSASSMNEGALILFVQVIGQKLCGPSSLEIRRNALISRICSTDFLAQLQDLTAELAVAASTGDTQNG
jgi:hypothetical protein